METSFVELLTGRARTMLPPATMMKIECLADAGDAAMAALLDEAEGKGLRGEDLCSEPWEPVVFDDRVLLRCGGCPRAASLPRVAGVGRGADEAQALRNALYALTLPLDRTNASLPGCLAAQAWGEGPARAAVYACILNRAAYLTYPAREYQSTSSANT